MSAPKFTFADLCGVEPPDHELPWLDRRDIAEGTRFTHEQAAWRRDGVVIRRNFIPPELIDDYCRLRQKLEDRGQSGGWRCPCPYLHYDEIMALSLYQPLMRLLESLIGHPMGLHLNLTGWVTTERDWHQDDYLNPAHVNCHYAAVWMALGDISPDSGPFEYVPGSHRWPLIRRDRLFSYLSPEQRAADDWPSSTQDDVAAALEDERGRRGDIVRAYVPRKGDVLIWHGRLMHRGSKARVPGTPRRAMISHYSSIRHRPDMPQAIGYDRPTPGRAGWDRSSGFYFPLGVPMAEGERV